MELYYPGSHVLSGSTYKRTGKGHGDGKKLLSVANVYLFIIYKNIIIYQTLSRLTVHVNTIVTNKLIASL